MISGTHTPDSGSVQLYGRHKAWKLAPGLQVLEAIYHGRGKADAAQSVTQSSLSGGRGVRHGKTQSVMSRNKTKAKIGQNIKVKEIVDSPHWEPTLESKLLMRAIASNGL